MPTRRHYLIAVALLAAACAGLSDASTAPLTDDLGDRATALAKVDLGYTTYVSGSTADVQTAPAGGVLLAGGGTDSDAGMSWLLARGGTRSPLKYGDVVVLRTAGKDDYNKYLIRLGANSVTSIVISSMAGANSATVANAIAKAEVIFIAGGDQSDYVNLWTGTALQTAVNARVAAGYPIGGTSAGLAVLSPFVYAALHASSVSSTVMANPYDASVTLTTALFNVPALSNVLADSHFAVRDRMGRLVTFLARLQQDGRATAPRGIGVDETSALAVSSNGTATVYGAGAGAFFLSAASTVTRICVNSVPATPLTMTPITAVHVPVGKTFNLATWSTTAAVPYTLSVTQGGLTSSTGSIY